MAEEVKKISFGFSKLTKKTSIIYKKSTIAAEPLEKVEFIDCLEGKSIKLKEPAKVEDTILVIPLPNKNVRLISDDKPNLSTNSNIGLGLCSAPEEKLTTIENKLTTCESSHTSREIKEHKKCDLESLDEIAAREILEELNKKTSEKENSVFSVPLTSNAPTGEEESTIEDYDNIPVTDFGLAMLRGMGWTPDKGMGKNEMLSPLPTVRPKGMGLGADKVIKVVENNTGDTNQDLKLTKGGFVRVLAGPYKDCYGQIEGFDEESGRLITKLVLKNIAVSFNEFMVHPISKGDYIKNSKVINVGKYEKYKETEGTNICGTFKERIPSPEQTDFVNTLKSSEDESNTTGTSCKVRNESNNSKNLSKLKCHRREHSSSSEQSSDECRPTSKSNKSYGRTKPSSSTRRVKKSSYRHRSRSLSPRRKHSKKHRKNKNDA